MSSHYDEVFALTKIPQVVMNIYELLTKCEVKIWLDIGQVLVLRVYGRNGVEVHKLTHTKKNEANVQTSCLTEQVWSIKAGSSLASRECAGEPLPRPIPFAHGVTTLRLARRIFFRPGARFSKAPETFWARKAIFSSSVFLKKVYTIRAAVRWPSQLGPCIYRLAGWSGSYLS